MKILVLGKGIANDGMVLLLEQKELEFDYLNPEEVAHFDYTYVIKAPGIPLSDRIIQGFIKKGIRILSDIEVAMLLHPGFYIGVTGSNGKTTTVSLICHLLKSGYDAVACGNIGYSIGKAVVEHPNAQIYVVELSSFQLECAQIDLNISVLLNIHPCHLDHHATFADYIGSKSNICIHQTPQHCVVYCDDDPHIQTIIRHTEAKKSSFSADKSHAKCCLHQDVIYYENKRIFKLTEPFKGKKHLIEDLLAAIGVVSLFAKIKPSMIRKQLKSFEPIDYRMMPMNPYIYNDAKSTNPYSTIAAIECFQSVFLICGGYDRKENLESLNDHLYKIKKVYAYGQTKDKIYQYMRKHDKECCVFQTVEEAFCQALKERQNEVVLYSPMFASFDQFENYMARGKYFNTRFQKYVSSK